MDIPPISRTDPSGPVGANKTDSGQSGNLRNAFAAVRKLNNLDIADREFSVVRDPASHRFVVVVLDRSTGTVLDQFPPEDILKMLTQLSPDGTEQTGETS
jgi:uncharacterized FlaG/YvyC family protein